MRAVRYAIKGRQKASEFRPTAPDDFALGEQRPVDPDIILQDLSWSLYCVDPDAPRVLLVQTPKPLGSGESPFYYLDQYRQAQAVLSLPVESLHALARNVAFDASRVILLHSTGRCGSTLVSRAFACIDGVCSISEPDLFTRLTSLRAPDGSRDEEVERICESAIKLHCRGLPGKPMVTHVLKFRSQAMELSDLMASRFPAARTIFLYRHALTWLDSFFRSLLRDVSLDDEYDRVAEEALGKTHPLIAEYRDPDGPMPAARTWIIDWISSMERCLDLVQGGRAPFCVRFEDLEQAPREAMLAMLRHGGLAVTNEASFADALRKDSQAGTALARSAAGEARPTPPGVFDEARRVLTTRPRLSGAATRIPGTWTPGQRPT